MHRTPPLPNALQHSRSTPHLPQLLLLHPYPHCLHPHCSPLRVRCLCVQYCDDLKSSPSECLSVSLSVLQLAPAQLGDAALVPAARHFALAALQHLIANSWNNITQEQREYLKNQAVAIVQNVRPTQQPASHTYMWACGHTGRSAAQCIEEWGSSSPVCACAVVLLCCISV